MPIIDLDNKVKKCLILLASILIFLSCVTLGIFFLSRGFLKKEEIPSSRIYDSKWMSEILESHNQFRKRHGVGPLTLNSSLSEISQKWADHLSNKEDFNWFRHNSETIRPLGLGENLYYKETYPYPPNVTGREAVIDWYNEIRDYDFEKGGRKTTSDPEAMIEHFTALVWKTTTQMGAAYSTRKLKIKRGWTRTVVVCNYFPAGNYYGQYTSHVLRPIK